MVCDVCEFVRGRVSNVTRNEPDEDYEHLRSVLDDAILLLRRFSEWNWAERLSSDRLRLSEGDCSALDDVLRSFRGMGSLNDVVLMPSADDAVVKPN